ncbi:MAG TPA: hypothetical protein DCS09_11710 [Porphyromonadaceae bacterium]|nr:hypothetical protein [Porphyromonadaceae bacterium]
MDQDNQDSKGKELTSEERKELQEGFSLEEMEKGSSGWKIVKKWLETRAFHTWANPRETDSMDEWTWKELNAYYAASNARELLDQISQAISRADYLDKVQKGEIETGRMKI